MNGNWSVWTPVYIFLILLDDGGECCELDLMINWLNHWCGNKLNMSGFVTSVTLRFPVCIKESVVQRNEWRNAGELHWTLADHFSISVWTSALSWSWSAQVIAFPRAPYAVNRGSMSSLGFLLFFHVHEKLHVVATIQVCPGAEMPEETSYSKVERLIQRLQGFITEESILKGWDFQPSPDDVIVSTPEKCGTTWMQQVVLQIHGYASLLCLCDLWENDGHVVFLFFSDRILGQGLIDHLWM